VHDPCFTSCLRMSPDVSDRDKKSIQYLVRSGLAGGVAGCVAKTVVAPLDRVKILFQASNPDFQKYAGTWSGALKAGSEIYRGGGIRALWQGHSATLLRVFPYAGIKFMAYDQVHHLLMPTRNDETNVKRFCAGALSGMISVFFTYPLELIRVRMAFQTQSQVAPAAPSISSYTSFTHVVQKLYREGHSPSSFITSSMSSRALIDRLPILKFYRGFTVTIIGMVPYAGVSFLSWGFLRAQLLPAPGHGRPKATPLADLCIGAVSGAVGQIMSYPFEVVRRRMQVGGITQPGRWLRWGETAREVWRTGGWRGFYVGLGIGLIKMVPMTAVSFAVWQSMKRVLDV